MNSTRFLIKGNSLLLLLLLSSLLLFAQKKEPIFPILVTTPPILDGKLDDEIWKQAPTVTNFKTFAPDFGVLVVEQTIVYLAYDAENLYFAFRCIDPEINKIKATVTSRDNIRSEDFICINLDSYNDQQGLYAFYVNPLGIQEDSRFSAGNEDPNIDYVWYSAGEINSEGYCVEVKIPFKSIRYDDNNPVEMGVILERYISRRSEHSCFPELDPAKGFNILTQMYPIVYENIKHYKLFEILPAVTYFRNYQNKQGNLSLINNKAEFSLTGKYGITSDLIVDATYNPDFSQVESDAGQVDVNLRYSLYYSEKRPFFLEGLDYFSIGATNSYENDPVYNIVHTRTIVNPLVGVKLTGKLSKNSTIASIYSLDELIEGNSKYSNFTIARYKLALTDDSYFGGIYAGRELSESYNRLTGFDGKIRINGSTSVAFNSIVSYSELPDTLLKQDGYTYGLKYEYQTRNLDFFTAFKDVSQTFQADMGYLTRTGIRSGAFLIRPKVYPKSSIIRRIDFELYSLQTNDLLSSKWETFNHASAQFGIFGTTTFKVKYSNSTEIFLNKKFNTGGFHVLLSGYVNKKFFLSLLYRNVNSIYYSTDPFQGKSNKITFNLYWEPIQAVKLEGIVLYTDLRRKFDDEMIYDYPIYRGKITYQPNKYLFFRGISEYNRFRKELQIDFLASFTYIPGTVVYFGYGSLFDKTEWDSIEYEYRNASKFMEMNRGFFFKASYLWRL
ncbi:MAG: DUF5916 domain-containing protein [Tenuifilaceae bacterium]